MSDQARTPKSLYDSSIGDIALKNFFAGFMHGLGGFFVTLLTWFVLYVLIMRFALPQLSGVLSQAEAMIRTLEKIQSGVGGTTDLMAPTPGGKQGITIPPELIKQFQELQKTQ